MGDGMAMSCESAAPPRSSLAPPTLLRRSLLAPPSLLPGSYLAPPWHLHRSSLAPPQSLYMVEMVASYLKHVKVISTYVGVRVLVLLPEL